MLHATHAHSYSRNNNTFYYRTTISITTVQHSIVSPSSGGRQLVGGSDLQRVSSEFSSSQVKKAFKYRVCGRLAACCIDAVSRCLRAIYCCGMYGIMWHGICMMEMCIFRSCNNSRCCCCQCALYCVPLGANTNWGSVLWSSTATRFSKLPQSCGVSGVRLLQNVCCLCCALFIIYVCVWACHMHILCV